LFFKTSNDKIYKILNEYQNEKLQKDKARNIYLNFWLNFSSNFRDPTFVRIISENSLMQQKLKEIFSKIDKFLSDNLGTEGKILLIIERFSQRIKNNLDSYTLILVRFFDFYHNVKESEISEIANLFSSYEEYFDNFLKFSKYDLAKFSNLLSEKPGWAHLDFKGNFSK
jgi:hypothetical protein